MIAAEYENKFFRFAQSIVNLSEQKTLNSINRSIIITVSHMANIMFMVIMDMTANCFGEMLPL